MQGHEFHSLFLGVFHLFQAGRHLLLRAAVDDHGTFRAETLGCTDGVHRRIAATDHGYILAEGHRSVGVRIGGVHQVDTGQVFIGRHDVDGVLARYVHEVGQSGAGSNEYAFETLLFQLFHADCLANDAVFDESDSHLGQVVYLDIHNPVRQTEFGDTVFQYTADFVQCLEYCDIVSVFGHVSCKGESGGTRTDHGYFDSVLFCNFRHGHLSAFAFVIGGEAFEVADGYGLFAHFPVDTFGFALLLLRAYTAAYGRKGAGLFQCLGCFEEFTAFDVFNETGDVDSNRTAAHTSRIGTVQTALGFHQGLFLGQSLVHLFFAAVRTVFGIELVHLAAFYIRAVFGFDAFAQLFAPRGVAAVFIFGLSRFAVLFEFVHLFAFDAFESTHTFQHFVEVHLMSVELRTVYTHEFCFTADRNTAGTAHACTVHHDGVQRYICGDFIFFSQQTYEFHHDGRADGKAFIYFFAFDDLFHALRYESFTAVRAVVCHDNHFVRAFAHLFFEDNQLLGSSCQNGDDTVSGSLESLNDRQHRSYAHATAGTDHCSEVLDVCGLPQWTNNIGDIITYIKFAESGRRKSHFLHNQSDGAFFNISARNSQWHTFALFAYANNDKMPCFTGFRY